MRLYIIAISLTITLGTYAQSFQQAKGVLVAAHRCGFYLPFPDNSIEMANHVLDHTLETPVIFEFDVRRSRDGTMYLMHDETINRTTNGTGYLKEMPDSLVNTLRLKSPNDRQLTLSSILSLSAWLDSLHSKNCLFMFDVKDGNLNQVVELIKKKNIEARSMLLLFTPERVSEFEKEKSIVAFSYLVEDEAGWEYLKNSSKSSEIKFAYITNKTPFELIAKIKLSGVRILSDVSEFQRNNANVYPDEFYKKFAKEKMLDILVTDFPIEVVEFLKK